MVLKNNKLYENCTITFFFQVNFLKEYIPKAFPEGDDLVLDAEILMIDNHTGQPLPFGSLGKHKVKYIFARF